MDDPQLMHVLNSIDELPEKLASLILFEFFFLDDVLKKLTFRDIFHDEKKLFWSFNNFVELYKVGVSNGF